MKKADSLLSSRRAAWRVDARFEPYPRACQRKSWEQLPDTVRDLWIQEGEGELHKAWPMLTAALYMDYSRSGVRDAYQDPSFMRRQRLVKLVMAECMEYEGRFLDEIVNGIWVICEESTWCWPAHLNNVDTLKLDPLPDVDQPIIDLGAGETAALMVWTYYLLRDELEKEYPRVSLRLNRELRVRILEPYDQESRFWWMSFDPDELINNWNPWCNSNALAVLLIAEQDEERKERVMEKLLRSLDRFISAYEEDGGCDEGPAYWGHATGALFNALVSLSEACPAYRECFDNQKIRNMARYIMNMYIGEGQFINFADSAAKLKVKASLIYAFGKALKDDELLQFGRVMYARQGGYEHWRDEEFLYHFQLILGELFHTSELWEGSSDTAAGLVAKHTPDMQSAVHRQNYTGPSSLLELSQDVWMSSIEVMVAREASDGRGLCLAAKGGHNDESHNHNDIGSFIVYLHQKPVLIDVGVGVYTSKTFSSERYTIWTMQSAYHQTPTVHGRMQEGGKAYRASEVQYEADGGLSCLTLELSKAYPQEAGIKQWQRCIALSRAKTATQHSESEVIISDTVQLEGKTDEIELHWMSAVEPTIEGAQWQVMVDANDGIGAVLEFDPVLWTLVVEKINLTDPKLTAVWGDAIYRTTMRTRMPITSGAWQFKLREKRTTSSITALA